MNILYIANELGYRGTPRYMINCAMLAHATGHNVFIWCLLEGGAGEQTCATLGIPVQIGTSAKALDAAIKFAPRIVHVHRAGGISWRDNALLRQLKRTTNCRILETNVFGTIDFTRNSPIDLHAQISRWDLWRWDKFICRGGGVYLPCCVDTEAFRPLPDGAAAFRRTHSISEKDFVVGRLGKTCWADVRKAVLPAMRKCQNLVFVSVDDYSGRQETFADWPDELNPRIVRIPRLKGAEELASFYSACDLVLNFSPIGESFGYVVAEAMACETPVVALSTPCRDNAQIELASVLCGSYPVRNPEAAAYVILKCAKAHPTREQKKRCRESVVERYSLQTLSPCLEKIYQLLATTDLRGRDLTYALNDAGFETSISDAEIKTLLNAVIGSKPSESDRVNLFFAGPLNMILILRFCRATYSFCLDAFRRDALFH